MAMQIETRDWKDVDADWLVLGVVEADELDPSVQKFDEALTASPSPTGREAGGEGQIAWLREAGDFTGKAGEMVSLYAPAGVAARRVLLLGMGKPEELTVAGFNKSLMTAVRKLAEQENRHVAIALPETLGNAFSLEQCSRTAATAITVGCVGQDLYRSAANRFPFAEVSLLPGGEASKTPDFQNGIQRGEILGDSMNLTRELVNRPAGEIYPESFAERAKAVAADCGLSCEVFDKPRLEKENMGAMLAVAAGSDRPPCMVVLEYRGAGEKAPTLGLCGKGVTFDSGGLSLKPTDNMKIMKCDMAGAATVLGSMAAIARLKLPVNVTGFMGMVENMTGGSAYKLGDVLKARNGVTIEVLNTDAEGRLVLADVLSYAIDQGVDRLIDLATLTGSCVVALGEEITGAFTNRQPWCEEVLAAAGRSGEEIWQLPMSAHFAELLKSDVADVKNVGNKWGGATQAAKFLEKFVAKTSWVHLDIAGPAFASRNQPHREGGATGCMLPTLVEVASGLAAEK